MELYLNLPIRHHVLKRRNNFSFGFYEITCENFMSRTWNLILAKFLLPSEAENVKVFINMIFLLLSDHF
jgi:hypothetical protein